MTTVVQIEMGEQFFFITTYLRLVSKNLARDCVRCTQMNGSIAERCSAGFQGICRQCLRAIETTTTVGILISKHMVIGCTRQLCSSTSYAAPTRTMRESNGKRRKTEERGEQRCSNKEHTKATARVGLPGSCCPGSQRWLFQSRAHLFDLSVPRSPAPSADSSWTDRHDRTGLCRQTLLDTATVVQSIQGPSWVPS